MIPSLTSLRFVFAMMIFIHHFPFKDKYVFPGGCVSVCFFFVLSGFILAYSYKERFASEMIDKKSFYIGRLSKLFPLHLICFFIALLGSFSLTNLLIAPINILLLQSWVPINSVYFSFNAVSWFSSDLLFFYLIFPLLVNRIFKVGWFRISMWGIGVLLVYWGIAMLLPERFTHAIFYINPLMRSLDFILGILLFKGIAQMNFKNGFRENKWIATLSELLAIILLALFVAYQEMVAQEYRFAIYYWIPVIFLLFVFVCFDKAGGIFSKLLSNKYFIILGEISFSFYMVHQLIIRMYFGLIHQLNINWEWWVNFSIVLFLTISCSLISFFYIEKPIFKWVKLKFSK